MWNYSYRLSSPDFSVHKLRHYIASKINPGSWHLADSGGETDHVMKSVYQHSMMDKQEQAKRNAAQQQRNSLFS